MCEPYIVVRVCGYKRVHILQGRNVFSCVVLLQFQDQETRVLGQSSGVNWKPTVVLHPQRPGHTKPLSWERSFSRKHFMRMIIRRRMFHAHAIHSGTYFESFSGGWSILWRIAEWFVRVIGFGVSGPKCSRIVFSCSGVRTLEVSGFHQILDPPLWNQGGPTLVPMLCLSSL